MTAKEQLYEKLSAEYAAFIDGLKGAPPDKIIDSAYEKVFKEDILSCFEYGDSFSEKQIAAMLALEYPLDSLYRNWLDTDVSYMDDLSDTISSFATREAGLQNGIDGEEVTKTVIQSDTHTAFIRRIEQNMNDYTNGKLSRSEQNTDVIHMSEAYVYLSAAENLSNSDMQYLLRFSNPLQVIADVYSNLDGTPGIEFALNRVLDNYNGCTNGYSLVDLNIQHDALISQVINGELSVGDWVIAAPSDEYGYLLGVVTAIDKLGTPEHDTENAGDDIHVDFYAFDYPPERIAEIEEQFSDLYREPKTFDELPLDDVIMAPDTLIRITELGHDEITRMGNLLQNCVAFCNCFPDVVEPQGDLHAELMERLDKNLADYHNSLMGFGTHELIDMAGKIAAMKDVYDYMTTTRGFDDDELQFYLQFQNPLEVVADAWVERNADNEDLCFTMDFVFDKKDALVDYPLMSDTEIIDNSLHRFMDVDLVDFLGKIADKTIIHNPEDWQSHSNALYRFVDTENPEHKRLMWSVSSRGAQMFSERYTFVQETPAFDNCVDYRSYDPNMFGYVVEITGRNGNVVTGNVFEVGDYTDFAKHVRLTALPLESITLKYSNDKGENAGKTITVPRSEYDNERQLLASANGKVTSIQYNPSEVERAMSDLLQQERSRRMAYPIGSTEAHLNKLADKLAEIRNPYDPEYEQVVQTVRAMDYGIEADEFEKRMTNLFPGGTPTAMSGWISYAEDLELDTEYPKTKSLAEYYVEFGLIKHHYGDELATRLFNLAELSCPNTFELRWAAKLLQEGVDASEVHDMILDGDLHTSVSEDKEFGKALIAFAERKAKTSPEIPPADKKLSIGDRLAAGNEKVRAYKEQKAQNPENTTKHKKEDVLE